MATTTKNQTSCSRADSRTPPLAIFVSIPALLVAYLYHLDDRSKTSLDAIEVDSPLNKRSYASELKSSPQIDADSLAPFFPTETYLDESRERLVYTLDLDCTYWSSLASKLQRQQLRIPNTDEAAFAGEKHFGVGIGNFKKMVASRHAGLGDDDLVTWEQLSRKVKQHVENYFVLPKATQLQFFSEQLVCRERPRVGWSRSSQVMVNENNTAANVSESSVFPTISDIASFAKKLNMTPPSSIDGNIAFEKYLSHDVHEDSASRENVFYNSIVYLQDLPVNRGGELFFTEFDGRLADTLGYHNISGVLEPKCGRAVSFKNVGNWHGVRGLDRGLRRCVFLTWLALV